jgi:hypothetical protein
MAVSAAPDSYWSGIQIQNQGSVEANVSITFYAQNGTEYAFTGITIAASDSVTYGNLDPSINPGGVGVPDGFTGSAVVQSDQPVVAIVNTMGTLGSDMVAFGASSGSFSAGSDSVQLPLLMKDYYGYYTWFNVQNASASTVEVYVDYIIGGDAYTEGPVNIDAGLSYTFDQSTNANLTAGVGSAVVRADGPVVATAVEVGPTTLFAYNGFTTGATLPRMPLVQQNNYGYVTGIQIMNLGTEDTNVTVSYTPSSAGDAFEETLAVVAGESTTFQMDVGGNPYLNGALFIGSGAVTDNSAGVPLVAVVNQLNSGASKGAAYGGFDASLASDTVNLPLIMDRNYGYFTGFSVVNAGSSSTDVSYTCTGADGSDYADALGSTTLAAGEAATPVQLNQIAPGYVGSCTATATGGDAMILGIVNELSSVAPGDAFLVYEGFNP